jgi:hypothetical protein
MDRSGARGKRANSPENRKRRWNGDDHGHRVQMAADGT